jgi:hypothetical protein
MRLFPVAILFFLHLQLNAQIDPAKLDSLKRSIDSSVKLSRAWQDSFSKRQDSIYRLSQVKARQADQSNNISAEKNKREKNHSIIFAIAILFLLTIIIVLLRRKSRQDDIHNNGS